MSSKQTVKEMFKSVQNSELHKYAAGGKPSSRISDENILTAFQMIDAHTNILRDQSVISNLDRVVNIISTIVLSTHSNECFESESKYMELIKNYIPMFIDDSINDDDEKKAASENVKNYVVYSCMIYYAVKMKDSESMKVYMTKISKFVSEVIKKVNEDYTKHQQEMMQKAAQESSKKDIITPETPSKILQFDSK